MCEGDYFTVEEAASIMGCGRRTVYDLIADGWLIRPEGKTKQETGGKVTKKSLYQFVIVDRLNRLSVKALKRLKKDRKLFEKSECKKAEANRFFKCEGTEETPENACPSVTSMDTNPEKRCLHHEFAERHQFSFGIRARQLAPKDPALQDDLVQEMSLAVLQYNQHANFDFLFELASNRAKDYLKYEANRGMRSLNAARHSDKTRKASLNEFIEELVERGVPREWIEEVINWRLDAA